MIKQQGRAFLTLLLEDNSMEVLNFSKQVFCFAREQHITKPLLESVSGKYLMKILGQAK